MPARLRMRFEINWVVLDWPLLCFRLSGSPHANLNQNNLKYAGTDNIRISTQIQERTSPPQSPNKNSGQAEKIVLLVCNRACAGQQGRRYWAKNLTFPILNGPEKPTADWTVLFFWNLQVWESFHPVFGAHSDVGCTSERDLGENATPFAPWRVCTGVFSLHLQPLIDQNIHSIKVALGL